MSDYAQIIMRGIAATEKIMREEYPDAEFVPLAVCFPVDRSLLAEPNVKVREAMKAELLRAFHAALDKVEWPFEVEQVSDGASRPA